MRSGFIGDMTGKDGELYGIFNPFMSCLTDNGIGRSKSAIVNDALFFKDGVDHLKKLGDIEIEKPMIDIRKINETTFSVSLSDSAVTSLVYKVHRFYGDKSKVSKQVDSIKRINNNVYNSKKA